MKWIMADKARIEAEKRATANVGSTSVETDTTSVSAVSDATGWMPVLSSVGVRFVADRIGARNAPMNYDVDPIALTSYCVIPLNGFEPAIHMPLSMRKYNVDPTSVLGWVCSLLKQYIISLTW